MASKNAISNETVMLYVLKRSLGETASLESKLVSEFHYGLFKRTAFIPKFKTKKIRELYDYLSKLVSIQGFKDVEELSDFLVDLEKRAGILAVKYEEADILEKIDIEQGFYGIYADETVTAVCKPRRNFFREITTETKIVAAAPVVQNKKKIQRNEKMTRTKEDPMLQSSL